MKHNCIIKSCFCRYCYLLIIAVSVLLGGCAGLYFRDAGVPPYQPPRYVLAEWPYKDYWTGIVFNGAKIGFTHLSLLPAEDVKKRFDIRSEAVICFRFLMLNKKVTLKSYDRVADDLRLESFFYEYNLDGNCLKLTGKLKDNGLEVEITNRGEISLQSIPLKGKLYPTSIINLYPVFHGLELGRHYSYQVYDGETQTVSTVTQEIIAYEESDLFHGKAFKIKTRLHGQEATTWINGDGKPLFEMSLGGVLIADLESERTAKEYLTQAAINKDEILVDFSLIKSNISIPVPERVTCMEVVLYGIGAGLNVPADERQQCKRKAKEVFCKICTKKTDNGSDPNIANSFEVKRYLLNSYVIPVRNELIRKTAAEITENAKTAFERISLLVEWIQENIERKPVDAFSALDVLVNRKAECQGHTFLYAAFARVLDIPTRVVNGIVYSNNYSGFLYHTWAESLVNGHWITVDPTFGQIPADATHIKLIESENISGLLPLVNLIGRLHVRIIAVDSP
jgi:hypothetical protein